MQTHPQTQPPPAAANTPAGRPLEIEFPRGDERMAIFAMLLATAIAASAVWMSNPAGRPPAGAACFPLKTATHFI